MHSSYLIVLNALQSNITKTMSQNTQRQPLLKKCKTGRFNVSTREKMPRPVKWRAATRILMQGPSASGAEGKAIKAEKKFQDWTIIGRKTGSYVFRQSFTVFCNLVRSGRRCA